MCSAYLWTFFSNLHCKYVYINTPDFLAQEMMINPTVHSSWLQFCSFRFQKYPAMCDDFVFSHGQIYRNVDSSTQNVDSSFQNVEFHPPENVDQSSTRHVAKTKNTRKCWVSSCFIHQKCGFWSTRNHGILVQHSTEARMLPTSPSARPGISRTFLDFPLWVVSHPQMLWMNQFRIVDLSFLFKKYNIYII